MTERTFVVIFFFWAFLTIITPTLVRLSESSKADTNFNETRSQRKDSRRMMDSTERYKIRTSEVMSHAEALVPVPAPAPTPAPALAAIPSMGTKIPSLARLYHRGRSNGTDQRFEGLSSST